ncbi:hypothetical protein ACFPOC_11705 [Rubellimicrobium aerolatum]|uniref:Uncharacterized protein n=1 Tax=Rubellimicrobium aerolatum TaxID=490979 RepID=A0ABW0SDR0_9RHOB
MADSHRARRSSDRLARFSGNFAQEAMMVRGQTAASPQYGVADQTDAFFIDGNGQLHVAWVSGAGAWNGPAPIGPAGQFPPGTGVAASPQYGVPDQTDVFAIDTNGQLHVAWVSGVGAWNGPAPIGPAGLFLPGAVAGVAASPQYGVPDQTDVFAVDRNGQLHVAWVSGVGAWNGPAPIGPAGLFPAGAAVAASPQYGVPDQTDVFAIGSNGQLHVAWVSGAGAWNGPAPIGPADLFPPGTGVAASPQYGVDDQTDVFAIDKHGQLHVAWVSGAGAWNGPAPIGPAGLFQPGAVAGIAASPQYGVADQTDVFAVDRNGQLHVAWVSGVGAWNGPAPIGPAGLFPPGTGVAASPQYGVPDQTDVFAIGGNGQLHVAWVSGVGAWNGPVGLAFPPRIAIAALQDGQGRFIEVTGSNFTANGRVSLDYQLKAGGAPANMAVGNLGAQADAKGAIRARIDVALIGLTNAAVKATDQTSNRSATAEI